MFKKLLLNLFTIFFTTFIFSQTKISGKIIDEFSHVKNAHIVNLSTNKGTFSNINGEFEIPVSLGDSLKITSIQHKTVTITVANILLKNKFLNVKLKSKTYILDEVIVRKHNLTGSLALDIKKTPKDTIQEIVNKMVEGIKNIDYSKPVIQKIDHIDSKVRPPLVIVDPIDKVNGLIFGATIPLQKNKTRTKSFSLDKWFEFKKEFPKKLLSELGKDFFYKKLKIPKEQFHKFIDYCSSKNIEQLYLENKILELIDILKKESLIYNKINK